MKVVHHQPVNGIASRGFDSRRLHHFDHHLDWIHLEGLDGTGNSLANTPVQPTQAACMDFVISRQRFESARRLQKFLEQTLIYETAITVGA